MGHKIKSIPCPLSPEEKSALLQVFPQGIVAFDLETTGLSPLLDEIIEIGAIKITADETVLFESFINPQRMIPESTIKIHGITDDMVKSAPLSSEVMPEFLEFNQGLPLFAHNARFDVGFIIRACQKLILNPGKGPVYCSCQLSRFAFKEAPNHRLKTLAEYLTLPLLNHHRAFDDAKACLMIIAKGMLKYQNEIKEAEKTRFEKPVPPLRDIKVKSWVYSMADFAQRKEIPLPEHLQALGPMLENEQPQIEILYKGGSHKGEFRPIKAVAFLPMPEGNVLYAHCLLSNLYKSFAVKKIEQWRPMQEIKKENV